jgi:hypothetical protein
MVQLGLDVQKGVIHQGYDVPSLQPDHVTHRKSIVFKGRGFCVVAPELRPARS